MPPLSPSNREPSSDNGTPVVGMVGIFLPGCDGYTVDYQHMPFVTMTGLYDFRYDQNIIMKLK